MKKLFKWLALASTIACICSRLLASRETALQEEFQELKYRLLGPLASNDSKLIAYVRKNHLLPPSSQAYNLTSTKDLAYQKSSKGHTWIHIFNFLKNLFSDEPKGFFVEAGALDGEFLSNSLWLERNLGWSGLLIEPDKNNFREVLFKHRRAWLSNTCLSNLGYPKEITYVSQDLRHGVYTHTTPWNHRGASHEMGIDIMSKEEWFSLLADEHYSIAQCLPLDTLLYALNVTTVDFLSLDIQGTERDVLRNFPTDVIKIRSLAVEIYENPSNHDFLNLMENRGFTLVNSEAIPGIPDHMYIAKDEKSLLAKVNHFQKRHKNF